MVMKLSPTKRLCSRRSGRSQSRKVASSDQERAASPSGSTSAPDWASVALQWLALAALQVPQPQSVVA